MDNKNGILIVIDGLDGSGKSTQYDLLKSRIGNNNIRYISFPNYDSNSGAIVKDYLGGKFNEENPQISAFTASSFYAVDRYISYKTDWGREYENGCNFIAARYVSSNAIYQMTKIPKSHWDSYLSWLEDFEFVKFGLPKPDMIVFLDMPVEVSQKLLSARYNGDESKKDIHEKNIEFLKACREAALYVAEKQGWLVIPCSENGKPLSIEKINDILYSKIKETLNA